MPIAEQVREPQVLRSVVKGALNKQIAFDLNISEVTVKLHRSSMMRKMNAHSAAHLFEAWQSLPAEIRLAEERAIAPCLRLPQKERSGWTSRRCLLVAWFMLEPVGLLVVVAAICIWLGWEAGLVSFGMATLLWISILILRAPLTLYDSIRIAVFLCAAGAIWLLVLLFRQVSLSDVLDQDSQRLVSDIP
ncbi:hypothetical protein FPZ08_08145 [Devosia ginsengisoli]|uniref:HTH luxR-type domain-containing protein n=1 Tax=Devosia ginsengisoli TaxID=400770 RepID=A0A5B8LSK1_9HYPH|nr:hypothetical protein FPZ08_08145 [Devosia ginsengisoli]